MSFGTSKNATLDAYIAYAYNNGLLLVAAAGNTPQVSAVAWPARYSQVIAVGGVLEDNSHPQSYYCDPEYSDPETGGSVTGSQVELAAPFHAMSMWSDGRYDLGCGTSPAAAHASAVAAVTWGYHSSWSRNDIRDRLQSTAIDLGSYGKDNKFGYGLVDVMRAVEGKPMNVNITGPYQVPSGGYCTWQAFVDGGTPPYSYSWSGALTGSGWIISGSVYNSGFLNVTVTDDFGNQKTDQFYIQIDNGAECLE